jgi:ammonium transporter Rh
MPGILGGVAGAIAAAVAGEERYGATIALVFPERATGRTASEQGGYQIAALAVTVGIAITSGFATGLLVRIDTWACAPALGGRLCCAQSALFDDAEYWEVPGDAGAEDAAAAAVGAAGAGAEESAPACCSVNVNVEAQKA